MTRTRGKGSGPLTSMIVFLIALSVFLGTYFLYLKPHGLLNLFYF